MFITKYHKYVNKINNILIQIGGNKFHVSNDKGLLKFRFDSDIMSYQSIYDINDLDYFYLTYISSLMSFLNYIEKLDNCLFIGLGGGHLPLYLNNKFPETQIDVVEINKDVVATITDLGIMADKPNIKIYTQDGALFIANSVISYDAIVIDLDGIESYETFDFDKVKSILNEYGILAINLFSKKHDSSTISLFVNRIKKSFKYIKHYKIQNNNICICANNINNYDRFSSKLNKDTISKYLKKHKYLDALISNVNFIEFEIIN